MPYILDGGLYYNCSVNPDVSSDAGCYHARGHWVNCQQPAGIVVAVMVIGKVGHHRASSKTSRIEVISSPQNFRVWNSIGCLSVHSL